MHDLTLNKSFRWTESSCTKRNLREVDGIREKEVFAALGMNDLADMNLSDESELHRKMDHSSSGIIITKTSD